VLGIAVGGSYDALSSEPFTSSGTGLTTDAFLHDRLMRAGYTLIPDNRRQLVHLTVELPDAHRSARHERGTSPRPLSVPLIANDSLDFRESLLERNVSRVNPLPFVAQQPKGAGL